MRLAVNLKRFAMSRFRVVTPKIARIMGITTLPLALAACNMSREYVAVQPIVYGAIDHRIHHHARSSRYDAVRDGGYLVPAVDTSKFDPRYLRQIVVNPTGAGAGTIVVDVQNRFLYLVMNDGRAVRYGIGVGRDGFRWGGTATIGRKAKWPTWTPPQSMIEREPELATYADGMEPGVDNPLGARALYLYRNDKDTLFRIHGTNEPWSIGKAVSSGCIRMLNQDLMDLYRRVETGAQVIVRQRTGSSRVARSYSGPTHQPP